MTSRGSGELGPTYRLQLTPSFGFAEATAIVPYLAELGVAFAYLSPVFAARPGSEHGYDAVDPTHIREELGGRGRFDELTDALHRSGLRVLLDIVPNHLSTYVGGPWWRDVLTYGRRSQHAPTFDISWDLTELPEADRGRVILPILGSPLEEVLENGELRVEQRPGGPVLTYFETELPLAPGTAGAGDFADVLAAQHYRLQWWREPRRNYRRFFTIDDLVGVRVEDPDVFDRTHRLVAELVEEGRIDALRVDHVDGLADPEGYLQQLAALAGDLPIVVEKILTGDEPLRRSWPIAGTTGYEVADEITTALGDGAGVELLDRAAAADGERPAEAVIEEGKRLVVRSSFPSEVGRVAALLGLDPETVAEAAVAMPVYRTYVTGRGAEPLDEWLLEVAGGPALRKLALEDAESARLEGVTRLQQLTSAAMAKGVEDTAWYRLVGKLPFLEVGGDPEAMPADDEDAVARMHRRARRRVDNGERGLVAGTTHDTKRSADVRARLLAIAETASAFEGGLATFAELVPARHVGDGRPPVPGPLDRRRIAETCLAMAPFGDTAADWDAVADRVDAALRKGAREAKVRDSWEDVNEGYEDALAGCARALLAGGGQVMAACFGPLLQRVRRFGATLSLAQVVLRSTLPGVPDCYQGDEVWNFSLVDPDNRRPVDYATLRASLERLPAPCEVTPEVAAEARSRWADGIVKLLVTRQCLALRARSPEVFAPRAAYVPLAVTDLPEGAESSILAFARLGADDAAALTVVTRAPHRLRAAKGDLPVGAAAWQSTCLELPPDVAGRAEGGWRDALSGARFDRAPDGRVPLAAVLATLPVAVLIPQG